MAGEYTPATGIDPTLQITAPTRVIDPQIALLAASTQPEQFADRDAVLAKARQEAAWDATQNKKIIITGDGPVHGHEYPHAFTFTSGIRGDFEEIPADRQKWTRAMELAAIGDVMGGRDTHVVIEFDDGEQLMVRRTETGPGEKQSAKYQKFDAISTKMVRNGQTERRPIDTKALASAVVVPGQPLTLDGKVTTGKVARITSFRPDEKGAIDPRRYQQIKDRPERASDALDRFNEAMRRAKREHAASSVGAAAMGGTARP